MSLISLEMSYSQVILQLLQLEKITEVVPGSLYCEFHCFSFLCLCDAASLLLFFWKREKQSVPYLSTHVSSSESHANAEGFRFGVQHCADVDTNTQPLVLFTASVDRISFRKALRLDADLALIGTVTWVGRSSLEISIRVLQSGLVYVSTSPVNDVLKIHNTEIQNMNTYIHTYRHTSMHTYIHA